MRVVIGSPFYDEFQSTGRLKRLLRAQGLTLLPVLDRDEAQSRQQAELYADLFQPGYEEQYRSFQRQASYHVRLARRRFLVVLAGEAHDA